MISSPTGRVKSVYAGKGLYEQSVSGGTQVLTTPSLLSTIKSIVDTSVNVKQISATSTYSVLKPATKYIISVTTFADVYVSLRLDWYEHTDKN